MPGIVIEIKAKPGDKVRKGHTPVVLSAMKMETVVKAPIDGKILGFEVVNRQKIEGDDFFYFFFTRENTFVFSFDFIYTILIQWWKNSVN
jgi:hypothetical protein